jgi:hypothetical protein
MATAVASQVAVSAPAGSDRGLRSSGIQVRGLVPLMVELASFWVESCEDSAGLDWSMCSRWIQIYGIYLRLVQY